MSMILRCPNCGTTRATLGECEACHEAKVRYFCTNHTPGLWLDTPTCPKCGALFGDPAQRFPAPAAPSPSRAPVPAPPRSSARASESSSARPLPRPVVPAVDRRSGGERVPRASEEALESGASGMAPWQRILAAVLRARYVPTAPERVRPLIRLGAAGCLRRLALLVTLVLVALVIALFIFGRALLHGLQP